MIEPAYWIHLWSLPHHPRHIHPPRYLTNYTQSTINSMRICPATTPAVSVAETVDDDSWILPVVDLRCKDSCE
jgi:hypothetical protein